MKNLTLAFALTLGALTVPALAQDAQPAPLAAAKRVTFEHRALTALLERHVHDELVDYSGLLRDRSMLDMYAKSVAAVTPDLIKTWDREERLAFWINVYNAYTLQLVLDNYDLGGDRRLESITDIKMGDKGPWDLAIVPMPAFHPDGKSENLTLNQIENAILRPQFGDPRIHAAVNCASSGCPPLRAEAYTGEQVESQLAEQMKGFLSQTSRNRFDKQANTVTISSIFKWYGDDFTTEASPGSKATDLRDFLIANAPLSLGATAEARAWIRDADLNFGEYDWKLNDFRR
jgi:hypothetical protein